MRKTLFLTIVLVVLVGAVASAERDIGIGAEWVVTVSPLGSLSALNGFAITGSPPVLPLVFGLSLGFGTGYFNLGITGDWWLWQPHLAGPLALYAGPGLFASIDLGGASNFSFGARGVLGLQLWPIDPLELFLEAGLNVGLRVGGGSAGLAFGIPIALGARFWF